MLMAVHGSGTDSSDESYDSTDSNIQAFLEGRLPYQRVRDARLAAFMEAQGKGQGKGGDKGKAKGAEGKGADSWRDFTFWRMLGQIFFSPLVSPLHRSVVFPFRQATQAVPIAAMSTPPLSLAVAPIHDGSPASATPPQMKRRWEVPREEDFIYACFVCGSWMPERLLSKANMCCSITICPACLSACKGCPVCGSSSRSRALPSSANP